MGWGRLRKDDLGRRGALEFHARVLTFLQGAPASWWNHMHFQHHAKPNCFRKDPDINMHPFFFALGKILSVEVSRGVSAKVLQDANMAAQRAVEEMLTVPSVGSHWGTAAQLFGSCGRQQAVNRLQTESRVLPGEFESGKVIVQRYRVLLRIQSIVGRSLCKRLLIPEGDRWPSLAAFVTLLPQAVIPCPTLCLPLSYTLISCCVTVFPSRA